jgi:hypothetical protein
VVVTQKLLHVNIPFIKTMFLYALAHMTIIVLMALGCIPRHSDAFQGTQLHSKERNLDSDKYIFSKATTLTYEIIQPDPLTQILFIIKYITANTILSHTLHRKCSELQCTLHIFLHWFLILIHPFLTYSFNTNEGKQKKNTC